MLYLILLKPTQVKANLEKKVWKTDDNVDTKDSTIRCSWKTGENKKATQALQIQENVSNKEENIQNILRPLH